MVDSMVNIIPFVPILWLADSHLLLMLQILIL